MEYFADSTGIDDDVQLAMIKLRYPNHKLPASYLPGVVGKVNQWYFSRGIRGGNPWGMDIAPIPFTEIISNRHRNEVKEVNAKYKRSEITKDEWYDEQVILYGTSPNYINDVVSWHSSPILEVHGKGWVVTQNSIYLLGDQDLRYD